MNVPVPTFSPEERTDLAWACARLERPSFAIWLSSMLGVPIEQSMRLIPPFWQRRVRSAAEASIHRTLDFAIRSLEWPAPRWSRSPLHRAAVTASGAASGFFGPIGLVADLPLTTTLMLRSIADVGRGQGEDLRAIEARLACMEVFALGGRTRDDDAAETGYYGLRVALGMHFSGVANAASRAVHVPYAIELARAIACRFGVVVSHQAAVRMIPVAGALGGATLNLLFMRHFEHVARGHFIVRRLERRYGTDVVQVEYERLSDAAWAGQGTEA